MEKHSRHEPVLRQPGVVDFSPAVFGVLCGSNKANVGVTHSLCQYNLQSSYSYVYSKAEATDKVKDGDVEGGVYDKAVCLSRTLARSCARIFELFSSYRSRPICGATALTAVTPISNTLATHNTTTGLDRFVVQLH